MVQQLRERAEEVYDYNNKKIWAPEGDLVTHKVLERLRQAIVAGEMLRFDDIWAAGPGLDSDEYLEARKLVRDGHDPTWPSTGTFSDLDDSPRPPPAVLWRPAWLAVRAELGGAIGEEAFKSVSDKFDSLLLRAECLNRRYKGYTPALPRWTLGVSPAKYVDTVLKDAVRDQNLEHVHREWQDAIDEARSLADSVALQRLQEQFEEMQQNFYGGEWPYSPTGAAWLHQWRVRVTDNPLLADASASIRRQILPTPKIADFGLCCSSNGPLSGTRIMGAEAWQSPEQQRYDDATEWKGLHETSPACEVYILGRMMIATMNGDLGKQVNDHIESFNNEVRYEPDAAATKFYPKAMIDIAMVCTQRVPVLRPQIEEVYKRVLGQTEKFGKRKELPMKLREQQKGEIVLFEADRYLLWT